MKGNIESLSTQVGNNEAIREYNEVRYSPFCGGQIKFTGR
jgi:hypothetical protein